MGGIDLHIHTTASDGTLTPTEAVALARERGLSVIAITDHDTTAGIEEARSAATDSLEIVTGVELSALHEGGPVHVLGYFFDLAAEELSAELKRLRGDRTLRMAKMVAKLNDLGVPATFERVLEIADGANLTRPHLARVLVELGVVANLDKAFTPQWIGIGGRAYVEKHAVPPPRAVDLIRAAGGVAVLAHPGLYFHGRPVPQEVIEEMAEHGMEGLEANHPDHTDDQRAAYAGMASRMGLIVTGASDCHGALRGMRMGVMTTEPKAYAALRQAAGLSRESNDRKSNDMTRVSPKARESAARKGSAAGRAGARS